MTREETPRLRLDNKISGTKGGAMNWRNDRKSRKKTRLQKNKWIKQENKRPKWDKQKEINPETIPK